MEKKDNKLPFALPSILLFIKFLSLDQLCKSLANAAWGLALETIFFERYLLDMCDCKTGECTCDYWHNTATNLEQDAAKMLMLDTGTSAFTSQILE